MLSPGVARLDAILKALEREGVAKCFQVAPDQLRSRLDARNRASRYKQRLEPAPRTRGRRGRRWGIRKQTTTESGAAAESRGIMKPLATLATVLAVSCFQLSFGQTEKEHKLIEANNEFAIRLLKVLPSPPDDNVFFSPYSLSTALGMAFIGARGATLQELAQGLGYSAASLNESDIQEGFSHQNSRLQAHARQAGLEVANSAAVQEGFKVLDSYYDTLNRTFNAHVFNVDFQHNGQQAVDAINEWVKQATHSKIDKLFNEPLDTDTRLVLMNAILFKGFWEREFEPSQTTKHVFYNGGIQGTQVDTMFLRHTTNRGFSEPLQSKVLELLYRDSDYSMVIVLPEERDGVEAVKQVLTMEKLNAAIASLRSLPVAISLPKCKGGGGGGVAERTATELRALNGQRSLPPEVRSKRKANPIPKHMSHELHEGRRKARVDRQRRQFKGDPYVTYVDVAAYSTYPTYPASRERSRERERQLLDPRGLRQGRDPSCS
ncbi:hypothetical protein HPB49_025521 [Dermacentor silvarum]|uniref:Uncharacterized protein n=1 Tax=Dermacentor silvarum TaxID=543639 RepID=A0ACB8D1F6_DERSI|nr:hypothetical protein HPB49_025521 [Dermacentor silvarum]